MRLKRQINYAKIVLHNFGPIMSELFKEKKSQIRNGFVFLLTKKRFGFALMMFFGLGFLIGFDFKPRNDVPVLKKEGVFLAVAKIDYLIKKEIEILPDKKADNILEKTSEPKKEEKKVESKKILKKPTKIGWIKILSSKDRIDNNIRNLVRSELSLMRYKCYAYFNKRVDVSCLGKDSFCIISFDLFLDSKKYKMKFKSFVSENGFDEIDWWEIFVFGKNEGIDNRILVERMVKSRPNCSPFASE